MVRCYVSDIAKAKAQLLQDSTSTEVMPTPRDSTLRHERSILDTAGDAASEILDLIATPFGLKGKAVHNLGTALSTKVVRGRLAGVVTMTELSALQQTPSATSR